MTKESTLKPFENEDVFVGATLLNNPDDDHAGDGRIIQFDSDLNEKGVLWTENTTHLVGGLKFDPDKTLWAFDSHSFTVIQIDPDGNQLPAIDFGQRSYSNVSFANDGNLYLGEHLVGDESNNKALEGPRKLETVLPFMPGTEKYGDGNVYKFTADGELLATFETETHGGMPGFLGVTASTISPDNAKIIYISELGNRIFQFDLINREQMDDLLTYSPDSGDMVIAISYAPNGDLYSVKANFRAGFSLCRHDIETGEIITNMDLPGPGWAALTLSKDGQSAYIGNFFNGVVGKFNIASGEMITSTETNVARSLAGIAEY